MNSERIMLLCPQGQTLAPHVHQCTLDVLENIVDMQDALVVVARERRDDTHRKRAQEAHDRTATHNEQIARIDAEDQDGEVDSDDDSDDDSTLAHIMTMVIAEQDTAPALTRAQKRAAEFASTAISAYSDQTTELAAAAPAPPPARCPMRDLVNRKRTMAAAFKHLKTRMGKIVKACTQAHAGISNDDVMPAAHSHEDNSTVPNIHADAAPYMTADVHNERIRTVLKAGSRYSDEQLRAFLIIAHSLAAHLDARPGPSATDASPQPVAPVRMHLGGAAGHGKSTFINGCSL